MSFCWDSGQLSRAQTWRCGQPSVAVEKVEGKAGHPASVPETPVLGTALGVGTGGRGCLCLGRGS